MGHGGWQGHRQYPEAKPFCFDPGSMVITGVLEGAEEAQSVRKVVEG